MKLRSGRKVRTRRPAKKVSTVPCSELPQIALESILRRARGRSIAGTNKYARVCRQWRDAGEDPESMQLLMNLSHLSQRELKRAQGWLSAHGQHVDTLVIHEDGDGSDNHMDWLLKTGPALGQLRRLEVSELDFLGRLAPVLQQLPQLQHLAVSLYMSTKKPLKAPPQHGCRRNSPYFGVFDVAAEHEEGLLPDMQEVCPQLTSLHLTVCTPSAQMRIPPSVTRLFSARLQQLTVADGTKDHQGPVLCASSLMHLSALQRLTLDGVVLGVEAQVVEVEAAPWPS
jgi:hypothetical protein